MLLLLPSVFEGVPQYEVQHSLINEKINIVELLTTTSNIFQSKGELRKLITGGGLSVNKQKIENAEQTIDKNDLLSEKYILVQKGKKDYYIIKAV